MGKLKTFAANAAILTATSLSLGAAGVLFNAWLTRNLGAAGMGLFGLMMAVYRFAVTFASAGAGLAATRLVAQEMARGRGRGAASAMKNTLAYSLFFGILGMSLLLLSSRPMALKLVDDIRAAQPFRILSFSLPFVAVSGAFSGYFTAVRRVAPASAVMIFEQLSQMLFTITVFMLLRPETLERACVLVAAGSTVSEGAAFLLHLSLYCHDRRKNPFRPIDLPAPPDMARSVAYIALPVGASACLRSALSTVKHLLVPASLEKSGLSSEQALSEYGVVGGMVLPVLLFPCAFLLGFSNLLVPEMAEYREKGKNDSIHYIIEYVFRITLIFSIGVAAVMLAFAQELGMVLYANAQTGDAIRALAPLVTVMYLDSAVDGMLKGLGEQVAVVRYNVYDTALCVVMVWFLLPVFGVAGYLAVIVLSEIFNMVLSAGRLVSVTSFRVDMLRWALVPAAAAAAAVLIARWAVLMTAGSLESAGTLLLATLLAGGIYYGVLRMLGCVRAQDLALIRRVFRK